MTTPDRPSVPVDPAGVSRPVGPPAPVETLGTGHPQPVVQERADRIARPVPSPVSVRTDDQPRRRKAPLGWLPWALAGAIALLLLLTALVFNAVDDDGAEGPADDSLGQVSDGSGDSPAGSDGGSGGGGDADVSGLVERAVVGGGAVAPAPVRDSAQSRAYSAEPGTAGVVLFAEGSAEITEAGQRVIASAVESLRAAKVTAVDVVGHTDVIAGDPVNDTLSQERADTVAAALRQQLPGVEVGTAAKSDDEPVAPNDTEQNRQLNRRAVIIARG